MQRHSLPLELLDETLSICRLDANADVPAWALKSAFLTVSRTRQELSITTSQAAVPVGVRCERDYRAIRVRGVLAHSLVGVLVSIAGPLADAGISMFAISTFDTDYVLVKERDLPAARRALRSAGHHL